MGWWFLSSCPTRQDIIAHLTRTEISGDETYETLKHCVRGDRLWMVKRISGPTRDVRFVALSRLAKDKSLPGWGSKDMDESVHPYYYDCPLSYLEDLSPPTNEGSREWREQVRAYHASEQAKRDRAKALGVGDTVTIYGKPYTVLAVQPRGRLRVRSHENGVVYSARASQLTLAEGVAPCSTSS